MSNLPKIADRIKELSYTTGTSDFLLNGNVTGFSSFASAFDSGDVVFYAATDGTDYEVGSGVFTDSSTDTISRFVLSSSNSNNLVSFAAGAKEVYSTYPATNAVLSTSGVVSKSSGVAFWSSDKVISHDVSFIWDSSNDRLGINKAVPSFSIDVGGDSASSVIQSSGIRTGVSGIFFPSGTSVPGYSGGRQVEHFERNVLGDANAEAVIELSGVVDQYIWLKKQSAGLVFAGPPSGCGGSCTDAMPSFRTLVYDDIPDLTTVSGALNADMIASGTTFVNDLNTASGSLNSYITDVSGILVDTPSGVHSYLARWSDNDTLGASNVYESGGYVGIRTNSPSFDLDVNGSGRFTERVDNHCGLIVASSGDANGELHIGSCSDSAGVGSAMGLRHSSMTGANDYMIMGNTDGATFISAKDTKSVNISAGGHDGDTKLELRDVAGPNAGFRFNVNKSDVDLQYSGDNETSLFYIDASTDSVGIKTSTPEFDLDVIGSGRFVHADGACGLFVQDVGGSGLHFGDCALSSNHFAAGIKHTHYTGGNDYMMVSDGTDTLLSAKDGGTVYLRGGGNAAESEIRIHDVGAGGVGIVFNEAGSDRDIRMEGANNVNLFRLDASTDRIGIGTALPSHTLSVSGAINADQIYNSGTLLEVFTEGTIATATTAGTKGQLRWDSNYLYVCVATNTWKRVLLSTW